MAWYSPVTSRISNAVGAGAKFAGYDKPDLSGYQEDIDASREMRDKFLKEYDQSQPRDVPQVDAAQAGRTVIDPTTKVERTEIDPTREVNAPQLGDAEGVIAANVPDADQVTAGQAASAGVQAPTINRGDIDPVRSRQIGAVDNLESAARGDAPSVAQEQLKAGLQSIEASQRSLAAGARGQNTAGAARRAARNVVGAQMGANAQAAMLRAQEMATARGQLSGALSDVRGSDQDLAKTGAGMKLDADKFTAAGEMDTSKFNTGLKTSTDVGNADRKQETDVTRAGFQQDASKFSAGARNDRTALKSKMQLDADTGNADRSGRRGIAQGGIDSAAAQQDAGADNKRAGDQAGLDSEREKLNVTEGNKVKVGNADRTLEGRQLDDREKQDLRSSANDATDTSLKGEDAMRGREEQGKENRRKAVSGGAKAVGKAAMAIAPLLSDAAAKTDIDGKTAPDLASLFGGGGGGKKDEEEKEEAPAQAIKFYTSDSRAKSGVKEVRDDVDAFLESMDPVTYRYKNPDAPGAAKGKRYGILAQDLEKSPMGASVVKSINGKKQIDVAQAVGAILAGMAKLRDDVAGLKTRRAR